MSTDALARRKKLGVIGPSTNTVVQPDYDDLRPAGVTNHYSRIIVSDAQAISDETFMAGTLEIDQNTMDAVRGVMTARPDYLVMGMSAVTFYGGRSGAAAWRAKVEDACGLGVSVGSEALVAALQAYGGIRRVGLISPYYPVANAEVAKFLADHDIEVVRDKPLRCPSWTSIAEVMPDQVRDAFCEVDGDDVDALIQVGTNLSAMRVAAAGELWLGKPVVAINTATYWHALRAVGIVDPIHGFGQLLERF
ncbi:MAG: Asp/Glu racemase [Hyphomicrobiaceae bacterium]